MLRGVLQARRYDFPSAEEKANGDVSVDEAHLALGEHRFEYVATKPVGSASCGTRIVVVDREGPVLDCAAGGTFDAVADGVVDSASGALRLLTASGKRTSATVHLVDMLLATGSVTATDNSGLAPTVTSVYMENVESGEAVAIAEDGV
jgi:hypothetical protein